MSQDVQQWEKELKAAGWKRIHIGVYAAPCSCLYRGPYLAWTVMLARKASLMPCPNEHEVSKKYIERQAARAASSAGEHHG